jgi:hypothetical protein
VLAAPLHEGEPAPRLAAAQELVHLEVHELDLLEQQCGLVRLQSVGITGVQAAKELRGGDACPALRSAEIPEEAPRRIAHLR